MATRRRPPVGGAAEGTLRRPPDMDAPQGGTAAALAAYLTERFLATYTHPFWTKFRQKCQEDHGFYTGTGQWDKAQQQKLVARSRAVLTINEIRPVIEIVLGYEAATPLETKPIPVGQEDLEDVLVFEGVFKHASKKSETEYECSAGFKDGVIGGLGAWYVGVDYAEDFVYGMPRLEKIEWDSFCYDPGTRRYDLMDARELFWFRRVAVDDLLAHYPDHQDAIEQALALVPGQGAPGGLFTGVELPARDRQDGYKGTVETLPLYDPKLREVVVVEAWYRLWKWEHVLVDKRLDRVTEVPPEVLDVARELARVDPLVSLVKKPRREFAMAVILPATKQLLSAGQPFENDTGAHPFVQFSCYREGDELLGMVRNLKDPQRDVNKRRSAMADAAGRAGRHKWFVNRGSLENPEALEDDTSDIYYFRRPDLSGAREVPPAQWPEWLYRLDEKAKGEIREASLINAPMQGQATGQSGIALAHLKQQGQIGTASIFRAYQRSRHLLAQRFGKRVQQCYSVEKTLRLETGAGQSSWVTVNERTVSADGTMQVVRDIPSLKWDVEMVDSPATPTARLSHLVMLLEIMGKLPPEYAEALADLAFEFADPPHREEIVRRIQAIQVKKGIVAPPNGGPAPGPPPGAPVPPASPGGATPGLVNQILQGAPGVTEAPMNLPSADNLRAAGMGEGALV